MVALFFCLPFPDTAPALRRPRSIKPDKLFTGLSTRHPFYFQGRRAQPLCSCPAKFPRCPHPSHRFQERRFPKRAQFTWNICLPSLKKGHEPKRPTPAQAPNRLPALHPFWCSAYCLFGTATGRAFQMPVGNAAACIYRVVSWPMSTRAAGFAQSDYASARKRVAPVSCDQNCPSPPR